MKKRSVFLALTVIALLVAGFFHETAREAAHYLLWVLYGIGVLGWVFLSQQEIDEIFSGITWAGFLVDMLFDVLIMVAIIAHGWFVLAAVGMVLIVWSMYAYYKV